MMISLVFSLATNRGTAANRDAQDGEYARQWPVEDCGDFFNTPSRYEWTGTTLIEFAGWQAEQDAAELAKAQSQVELAIIAEEDRRSWLPIEHPNGSGVFHKSTTAISETLHRFAGMTVTDPLPINSGYWDDVDGNPVAFTYQDLTDLRNAIYDRAAYNYGVRKYHVGMMQQSADPLAYDFSGGWA